MGTKVALLTVFRFIASSSIMVTFASAETASTQVSSSIDLSCKNGVGVK
jgi:hypothetical protein